jgi:Family of unknown function (DUF5677)
MFHDELMPDDERRKFHVVYGRLSDAVGACLSMFLRAIEEVRSVAYKDQRDIHMAPLLLMYDFAEAIDGVAVLVRSGSAKNCSQLLRTALELQLSLKYMMEHRDTYEQRCLSYEFYHLQDQLRWAQRCDPDSQVGKQLRAEIAGDQFANLFDVQGRDVKGEASDLEARMNSPRYAAIRAEIARMKAAKIRDGGWFSLWDGPKTVRWLAIHLKIGSLYDILYRLWSSVTHGESAIKRASGVDGDMLQMSPIRSPERLPEMCRNACQMANSMTMFLVEGLVPHLREEMKQRYIKDIKPGLVFIDSVKGL